MKCDFVSMFRRFGDAITLSPVSSVCSFVLCVLSSTALLLLLSGCEEGPLWDEVERAWGKHDSTSSASTSDAAANPPAADSTADVGQSASAAAPGPLVYKYGGFHGGNAVEDPNTQIADLHMTRSGLRYKWAKGNLRNWGVTPDTNAGALACAFYWDGKQWVGGKFDWISTSRTTRDWVNLNGHYNGWNPDAFWAAPRRAFCIVSKDGKKRTNLLETKEP